ncbi:putative RNAse III [Aspergillus clavatus NRRL 1]|uniref:RNAse III, putative n=1 Tax=Aspergillus clavatus (strain ATCC 1007 / CBS 513.65 / DSM 816 / NCTC 3887 / NRRL 1 / QM 1276 / 107) TaxID=344612 RepID=A1CC90_ASPCL|nr:RNAse III, putative [Aspergillus clavatus NRRL 1]EAW12147.1 RNAse III, putative [Aspergillus clavatus NRRL 1]
MSTFHQVLEWKATGVEETIGYKFADRAVLKEALLAPGSVPLAITTERTGNKDLAQIGDAVLRLILILDGYIAKADRAKINDVVSPMVSNPNLAAKGFKVGLEQHILANPSQQGLVSHGVMANAVEAILGAVYLDSNLNTQAVRSAMACLGLAWPVGKTTD